MSEAPEGTLSMESVNTSSSKSIRVFKNSVLEWMTHVHPMTPALLWLPMVIYLYWRAVFHDKLLPLPIIQVSVAALFLWTLSEYLIHRFVFHWRSKHPIIQTFTWVFHGIHHELPNDRTRLLMPPLGSLSFAILFYILFRWVLGPVWVSPFFASFVLGYLLYDYIHFFTHFRSPKTVYGRLLKKNHMEHHFVSDQTYYGVSSPLWDYFFGTSQSPVRRMM